MKTEELLRELAAIVNPHVFAYTRDETDPWQRGFEIGKSSLAKEVVRWMELKTQEAKNGG